MARAPYGDRFPFTFQNELVACGPCQPQFSRNALEFFRYFKVPVVWTLVGGVLTSAVGEKGRSSYGQDQVVSGFSNVIATCFYTNLYQDGAFADNDCFFRAYGMSCKIDPNLYLIDDNAASPTLGQVSLLPNNAFTTNYPDELSRLLQEAMCIKMIQRNSACEFALGRVFDSPQSTAGGTGEHNNSSGLANVVGQEFASAICNPGNTGSKRPIYVVEQTVPLSVTQLAGTPIEFTQGQKLCSLVEVKLWGEDVYSSPPVPLPV